MSPKLAIEIGEQSFAPGDTVTGSVLVAEGGSSRSVEAWLAYFERTADYSGSGPPVGRLRLHEGELTEGQRFDFALQLPPDAPPAYRSKHGEMHWVVEVRSNELGVDTVERGRIEVGPNSGPTT